MNREEKDLKIIDLDKLNDDAAIDYEKFAQEEHMAMESNEDKQNTEIDEKPGFIDHIFKINWHIVLLLVLVVSVFLVIYRVKNWGTHVDLNELDYSNADDFDIEDNDEFLPLIYKGDAPAASDGETHIVLLGNDTFAQNRGTKDDMANMIAELTDATVYNCAVTGSFMASSNYYIDLETNPMDAFNLYWFTTAFTVDNKEPYEKIFADYGDAVSSDARAAFDTLCSIDFDYVDVIGIMYDAHDYLADNPLGSPDNPTDILSFAGNMEASIELIKQTYPHIRIIVMSPTYTYVLGEDGDYLECDFHKSSDGYTLADYVLYTRQRTSTNGVSFVDNFYGTVNAANADSYLLDHINLNTAGREKLATRFVEALTSYDNLKE